MFKIVVTNLQNNINTEREFIPKGSTIEMRPSLTEDDLIKNLQDVDAVISTYEPFTSRVLESLPRLKMISQSSIGFNNIDLEAAKKNNIAVMNCPNYCTSEVADHAMALILALTRNIVSYNRRVHMDREWKGNLYKDVTRLSDLTLGLFGFGRISREVARRAQAFGMKILAFDPYIDEETGQKAQVKLLSTEELLKLSDIISIHTPLTPETKGFFNLQRFEMMERKPYIINVGRGPIISEKALVKALDLGLIRGAGLDVLEEENSDLTNSPLIGRDNVILTPHIAYYSKTSQYEVRKTSAQNIRLYIDGEFDKLSIVNGVKVPLKIN